MTSSKLPRRTLLALTAAFVLWPSVSEAQNVNPLRADVVIVVAREEGNTIDPELQGHAALRRAPFNAFRSMRVHSRPRATLDERNDAEIALPNGRKLQIKLLSVLPDGRYRIQVSINRPGEADYLRLMRVEASEGSPFFVAGQSFEGGNLIVGVTLSPR